MKNWVKDNGDSIANFEHHKVFLTKRGVKKRPGKPINQKLPISTNQLDKIIELTDQFEDGPALALALVIMFLSFLRQSNVAVKSKNTEHSEMLLKWGDIKIDSNRGTLKFLIKETKTRKGDAPIFLQLSSIPGSRLCPLRRFSNYTTYLENKMPSECPLLLRKTRTGVEPLTNNYITLRFRQLLDQMDLDPTLFSLHSLRRAGVLTAKLSQVCDADLHHQGTWKSGSMEHYIGPFRYAFQSVQKSW